MSLVVLYKLMAIVSIIALGWGVGRKRWLSAGEEGDAAARALSNAALFIFIPAILLRTTLRLDLASLPWRTVGAFFVPAVCLMLLVYAWERRRGSMHSAGAAAPAVRALSASFGNSVQLGVPLAATLFGETGLEIHVALISLHALILLSFATVLAELDLERASRHAGDSVVGMLKTLSTTVRNVLIHPVTLPVLLGLLWNATGLGLHSILDEILIVLGSAVTPVCLVLIGLSLAHSDVRGHLQGVLGLIALKLLVLPGLVLAIAHWGFGVAGLPLRVLVVFATLPVGSNPLIFAQRYDTLAGETTAAVVGSTLVFALALAGWLAVLARFA